MKIKSYAKINIGLNILYKRLDNYHELESIMTLVDLHDNMDFEVTKNSQIVFSSNLEFIDNTDNLVYRIAKYLQEKFEVKNGVKIYLEKNIPVSGGMGGGSTNAATTITTLNELWDLKMSDKQMQKIGLEFGADIPFCINRKPAIVKGIGEVIEPFTFESDFDVIVVKMPFGLSTKRIFDSFDAAFSSQYSIANIKKALVEVNRENFINSLGNNLEEVSIAIRPEIQQVKDILVDYNCFTSLMSGSGPTVLGFIDKNIKSDELIEYLKSNNFEAYRTSIMTS